MGTIDSESFAFLMYHSAEDVEFAKKLLHDSRRQITVIDMLPRLAGNAGKTSRWVLMKSLALLQVELRPSTKLLEITDDAVVVETEEGKQTIPADTVVMAVGAVSVDDLADKVKGDGTRGDRHRRCEAAQEDQRRDLRGLPGGPEGLTCTGARTRIRGIRSGVRPRPPRPSPGARAAAPGRRRSRGPRPPCP